MVRKNKKFNFTIEEKVGRGFARLGRIETPHGIIRTPAFVPVGTRGALRGLDFSTAVKYAADIFMVNTFHFFHNDRYKTVKKFGGLHAFMNIPYPLMTDSGGFQVFSLGFGSEHGVGKIADIFPGEGRRDHVAKGKSFIKVSEEKIVFTSPRDGRRLELSPEFSIDIQEALGADFVFAFDECTSPLSDYEYTKNALMRTHRWETRSLKRFKGKNQALLGIIQGGEYKDLRVQSARVLSRLGFFGFGIGGSLGKSKADMHKVLDWTIPVLPEGKFRHLLGIGEIDDILEGVDRGIDTFDCVIPTRWARHGSGFSAYGRIDLRNAKYLLDKGPIDRGCICTACQNHSRAYVCHLLREKEIYGIMLLAEHNIAWILTFMEKIRTSIAEKRFSRFKKETLYSLKKHA